MSERAWRVTATYPDGSEVRRRYLTRSAALRWGDQRLAGYPADDERAAIPPAATAVVEVAELGAWQVLP